MFHSSNNLSTQDLSTDVLSIIIRTSSNPSWLLVSLNASSDAKNLMMTDPVFTRTCLIQRYGSQERFMTQMFAGEDRALADFLCSLSDSEKFFKVLFTGHTLPRGTCEMILIEATFCGYGQRSLLQPLRYEYYSYNVLRHEIMNTTTVSSHHENNIQDVIQDAYIYDHRRIISEVSSKKSHMTLQRNALCNVFQIAFSKVDYAMAERLSGSGLLALDEIPTYIRACLSRNDPLLLPSLRTLSKSFIRLGGDIDALTMSLILNRTDIKIPLVINILCDIMYSQGTAHADVVVKRRMLWNRLTNQDLQTFMCMRMVEGNTVDFITDIIQDDILWSSIRHESILFKASYKMVVNRAARTRSASSAKILMDILAYRLK